MSGSINFRELVREIHPDLNPNVTDPGLKMAEAVRFKNNPEMLFRLAVRWGLREAPSGFTNTGATWNTGPDFTAGSDGVRHYQSGMVVLFRDTINIVYDIEEGNGNKYPRVCVFCPSRNKLYYFRMRDWTFREKRWMPVLRNATEQEMRMAMDRADMFNRAKEEAKQARQEMRNRRAERAMDQGLTPNTNFEGQNVMAFVRTVGRYVQVIRTTAKCVYYWDNWQNKERRANLSSVLGVNVNIHD